jgi:hypothetical protein
MPANRPDDPRRATPLRDLSWACHICGDERPDVFISVMRRPLERPPTPGARANIRFCNDRPGCATTAATMSNFGGIKLLPGVASP